MESLRLGLRRLLLRQPKLQLDEPEPHRGDFILVIEGDGTEVRVVPTGPPVSSRCTATFRSATVVRIAWLNATWWWVATLIARKIRLFARRILVSGGNGSPSLACSEIAAQSSMRLRLSAPVLFKRTRTK